eukprot:1097101-Pleurochrysis_carterae.AAC.2
MLLMVTAACGQRAITDLLACIKSVAVTLNDQQTLLFTSDYLATILRAWILHRSYLLLYKASKHAPLYREATRSATAAAVHRRFWFAPTKVIRGDFAFRMVLANPRTGNSSKCVLPRFRFASVLGTRPHAIYRKLSYNGRAKEELEHSDFSSTTDAKVMPSDQYKITFMFIQFILKVLPLGLKVLHSGLKMLPPACSYPPAS